jgi:outer membrane protein assembly factor BamB
MEWHFRNREIDGFSYTNEEIKFPMKELWSLTLSDSIRDTPIYAEDAIFVTTLKNVYKLNSITGEIIWMISPDAPLRQSPAYYKGRIYFKTDKTSLYCINSLDGKENWKIKTGSFGGTCQVDNGKLYDFFKKQLNPEKRILGLACYSLEDRSEIWSHICNDGSHSTTNCVIKDGILTYGDNAGNIYGLDSITGRQIWSVKITDSISPRIDIHGEIRIPHATELWIVDEIVIVMIETPGQTLGLDLKTGQILWLFTPAKKSGENYNHMAVDDKSWYCLNFRKIHVDHSSFRIGPLNIYHCDYLSFDIKTGRIKTNVDIIDYMKEFNRSYTKRGLIIGDYHFIGTYEPPHVAAVNKNTGELIWTHSIDRSNLRGDSQGIFADGKLIWVRITGDIYCFG